MKLATILLAMCAVAQPLLARFIKSRDSTRLYAEAKGDPSNPHLVWIHGFLLSSLVFDKLFEDQVYLDNLYMVRYDMRGFGQSDKPLEPSFYQSIRFGEDFDAVVQAFGLNKPFVAGWSYGGSVAVDIYSLHGNDVISGFVYMAGLPYTNVASSVVQPGYAALGPSLLQDTNVTLYNSAGTQFIDLLVQNSTVLPFDTRVAWLGLGSVIPQAVKANLRTRTQDPTRFFNEGGPSLPVLFVEGAKDRVGNDTASIEFLRPHFKKFEILTLPDAGHASFLDEFEAVRASVLEFVNKVGHEN